MQPDLRAAGAIGYTDPLALHLATLVELWGTPEFRERLTASVGVGLGVTDSRVLWELGFRHRSRPGDLARVIGLGAPSISKSIARLRSRGLIERVSDPSDARAGLVMLTDLGKQTTAKLYRAGDDLIGRLTQNWSDSDRGTLTMLLGRLAETARELAAGWQTRRRATAEGSSDLSPTDTRIESHYIPSGRR